MPIIIPLWFYQFGSVMYMVAAAIGLLLCYFSLRLYRYTGKREHMLLLAAFALITAGFVSIAASNTDSLMDFKECNPNCTIGSELPDFASIILGNYVYYATSLVGYFLLAYVYSGETKRRGRSFLAFLPMLPMGALSFGRDFFVLYPFETNLFHPFHIASVLLLAYIAYRAYTNYARDRSQPSMLVLAGFVFIMAYHALMFSTPFNPVLFAVAHLSLLIGFGSLLYMLVRVNRK